MKRFLYLLILFPSILWANSKVSNLTETTTPTTTDYMYIVHNATSMKVTPASLLALPGASTSYLTISSATSTYLQLSSQAANNLLYAYKAGTQTFSGINTFTSSNSFNGNIYISSGLTLKNGTGSNGQFLTSGGVGTSPTWTTSSGGTPAGGNYEIQFTSNGAFGSDPNFNYDWTIPRLNVPLINTSEISAGAVITVSVGADTSDLNLSGVNVNIGGEMDTFISAGGSEQIYIGADSISSLKMVTIDQSDNTSKFGTTFIPATGTVDIPDAESTVTGTNTLFLSELSVGDILYIVDLDVYDKISFINSDTELILEFAPGEIANSPIKRNIPAFKVTGGYDGKTVVASTQTTYSLEVGGVVNSTGIFTNGIPVGLVFSTYSASGIYNFTTTTSTLAIGTSSSTITLTSPGTYRINATANLRYSGATFAANQFVTLNLYRQNNTPSVIPNSQTIEETGIVTTLTAQFGQFNLPDIIYTTTNSNDVLSLRGSITATPGAGNFQSTEANILAVRIQ